MAASGARVLALRCGRARARARCADPRALDVLGGARNLGPGRRGDGGADRLRGHALRGRGALHAARRSRPAGSRGGDLRGRRGRARQRRHDPPERRARRRPSSRSRSRARTCRRRGARSRARRRRSARSRSRRSPTSERSRSWAPACARTRGSRRRCSATLADEGINLRLISTSPIKISCLVARDEVERAVRALHARVPRRRVASEHADRAAALQSAADARSRRRIVLCRPRGAPPLPLVLRRLGRPRRAEHRRLRGHEHRADRGRRDPAAVATRPSTSSTTRSTSRRSSKAPLPEDYESLAGPTAAGLREASHTIVDPRARAAAPATPVGGDARGVAPDARRGARGAERNGLDRGRRRDARSRSLVIEAADRIGVRRQVEDGSPEDAGRIEILRSDELDTAQDAFQLLNALAWLLPAADARALRARRLARGATPPHGARIGVARLRRRRRSGSLAMNLSGSYIVTSSSTETRRAGRRAATRGTSSPSSSAARSGSLIASAALPPRRLGRRARRRARSACAASSRR